MISTWLELRNPLLVTLCGRGCSPSRSRGAWRAPGCADRGAAGYCHRAAAMLQCWSPPRAGRRVVRRVPARGLRRAAGPSEGNPGRLSRSEAEDRDVGHADSLRVGNACRTTPSALFTTSRSMTATPPGRTPRGGLHAAHAARGLALLPARPGEVASHDELHRHELRGRGSSRT